jgi:hypothetical protein
VNEFDDFMLNEIDSPCSSHSSSKLKSLKSKIKFDAFVQCRLIIMNNHYNGYFYLSSCSIIIFYNTTGRVVRHHILVFDPEVKLCNCAGSEPDPVLTKSEKGLAPGMGK